MSLPKRENICNFHKWKPTQGWAVLAYRLYIYFWFHELKLPKVLNDHVPLGILKANSNLKVYPKDTIILGRP